MKLFVLTLLLSTGIAFADDEREMQTLDINGLELSGAEYWPYIESTRFNYPDDVLWGFYPEEGVPPWDDADPNPASATDEAIACATTAFRLLKEFFNENEPVIHEIVALGAEQGYTNKFYLWINDYTKADDPYPFRMRMNRFWYWKRNPPVDGRTPGFWKWESTLLQDGTCLTPDRTQVQEFLESTLAGLRG